MYIAKSATPRVVTLPDGSILSRADLPAPDTARWVARRKAAVAHAVLHGLLTPEEARRRYDLSREELGGWISAVAGDAPERLKVSSPRRATLPAKDPGGRRAGQDEDLRRIPGRGPAV